MLKLIQTSVLVQLTHVCFDSNLHANREKRSAVLGDVG